MVCTRHRSTKPVKDPDTVREPLTMKILLSDTVSEEQRLGVNRKLVETDRQTDRQYTIW